MYLFDSKINNNNNNEKNTQRKDIYGYFLHTIHKAKLEYGIHSIENDAFKNAYTHTHLDVGIHLFDGLPSISYERSQEAVCIIVNNDNENEKRS